MKVKGLGITYPTSCLAKAVCFSLAAAENIKE